MRHLLYSRLSAIYFINVFALATGHPGVRYIKQNFHFSAKEVIKMDLDHKTIEGLFFEQIKLLSKGARW
ncbi:MAG TPA: hypothetical protein VJI46_01960 [Candidatus Nanoarchaeia archaeon]|nr:hypothetical protein [Candidatus Nanoarchaeia archaeon]